MGDTAFELMILGIKPVHLLFPPPIPVYIHTSRGHLDSLSLYHSLPTKKIFFFTLRLNRTLNLFKSIFIMGI